MQVDISFLQETWKRIVDNVDKVAKEAKPAYTEDELFALPGNHPLTELSFDLYQFTKGFGHLIQTVEDPNVVHFPTFLKKVMQDT